MANQQFFPFLPENMTWQDWNGNLLMYFAQEPIPYTEEIDWRITAKNVTQLPTFEVFPIPDPERFNNWQDWTREFTLILNGPSV